jgi:hypothetical protein
VAHSAAALFSLAEAEARAAVTPQRPLQHLQVLVAPAAVTQLVAAAQQAQAAPFRLQVVQEQIALLKLLVAAEAAVDLPSLHQLLARTVVTEVAAAVEAAVVELDRTPVLGAMAVPAAQGGQSFTHGEAKCRTFTRGLMTS